MSSNNPNANNTAGGGGGDDYYDDDDYDYGDAGDNTTTATGTVGTDDDDDDDGYDYGGDDATTGYGDPTVATNSTTGTYHDDGNETANSGYDDDYFMDDGGGGGPSRFGGGGSGGAGGEQYDAGRPDHARASYTQGSGGNANGNAMGPGQYNDYDYDSNSFYSKHDDSNYDGGGGGGTVDDEDDMMDEEDAERVPFRPSVRNYDHFDRDGDFQDEYDSDDDEEEGDDEDGRGASFYKGREQYEYRNDEAEEERRIRKKKKINFKDESVGKKIIAAVCCCCICLITILLLVLFLLVFNENEIRANGRDHSNKGAVNTNRPTPRPTYPIPPALQPSVNDGGNLEPWIRVTDQPTRSAYPTRVASSNPTSFPTGLPTPKPTISPAPTRPVPPTITLEANADTYVYVDGFHKFESYGKEDSFLVQNGLAEYYEFGDAMALVLFDVSTLPTKIQMIDYEAQAILRLNHLDVNEKFDTRVPATISVRKLESTGMRIETLHGGMVSATPEDSILAENNFTVGLTQDRVYVDITDLLYPVNFTNDGYDRNELLLMLFNNSTEQGDPRFTELEWQDQAGDRFKSIESGDGPSLTISYNPKQP